MNGCIDAFLSVTVYIYLIVNHGAGGFITGIVFLLFLFA